MKKLIKSLFISSVVALSTTPALANQVFVEAKGAYYYPQRSAVRDTYSGNGIYGAEIDCQLWKNLFSCLGASYFTSSGTIPNSTYTSRLSFLPIDIGLKGIYNYDGMVRPYVGASIAATYIHIKTNSPYLIRSNTTWNAGGIFKVGTLISPLEGFLIDLFINYQIQPYSFSKHGSRTIYMNDSNISGFAFGAGLGYQF